jgi:hypothetical protein
MFFADIMMPFMVPYFLWLWLFPVTAVALALEMVVFKIAYRHLTIFSVIACTLGANAASWFLGLVISAVLLPSGIVRKPNGDGSFYFDHGPNYETYIFLAFILALLLSIVIEWGMWRRIFKKAPLNSLGLTSALANVVSYAVLISFYFW